MSTIKRQPVISSLKQFNCPNCGGILKIVNRKTKYVSCEYCGSVIDSSSESYQIIDKLENPGQHKPRSFIKLGLTAWFDDTEYMVIGRTRWKSKFKEYWADSDGSGYSDEHWEYDEWLLISEKFTYFYLIEDSEGYSVSISYTPKFPNIFTQSSLSTSNGYVSNFDTSNKERLMETGTSAVVYFEGESTYQIKAGDKVRFQMYKRSGTFIAEWRYDEKGTITEIEFFKEQKLSFDTVFAAFEHNTNLKELAAYRQQQLEKGKSLTDIRNVLFIASVIFFFLWIFLSSNGDKVLLTHTFPDTLSDEFTLLKDTSFNQELDFVRHIEFISKNPISFHSDNHICNFDLKASIYGESFCYSKIEILNGVKYVNGFDCNFYYDTNEEDEVSSNLNESKLFAIEKNGDYFIKFIFEAPANQNSTIKLSITEGATYSLYFLIAALIFAGVGVIIHFKSKNETSKKKTLGKIKK